MAELTSASASPAQPGTSGYAPQPPQAPAQPAQTGAPPSVTPDKPAQPQVNLHELPQFRQVQANYERQLAEERKKRQEAEMRGLDDFEKVQYENQNLREQLEAIEAQRQEMALQAEKFTVLTDIAVATGVPLDALMQANNEGDAWRIAWQMRAAQAATPPQAAPPQPAQQNAQTSWANPVYAQQQLPMPPAAPQWTPDVGGAAAINASDRFAADIAEAQRRGDPTAYVRALRQQQGG